MIAHTAWPIVVSIWILSAGCVLQAIHVSWVFRRHLELQERVHRLEMERDFPNVDIKSLFSDDQ